MAKPQRLTSRAQRHGGFHASTTRATSRFDREEERTDTATAVLTGTGALAGGRWARVRGRKGMKRNQDDEEALVAVR